MTWARWLGRGWLLLALAGAGCASGLPERLPDAELLEPCRALPQCCRSQVHVFLVNTVDPCDAADLGGLRAFLIDLGFIKTSCGQLYHAGRFANDVRQLRATDPEALVVLIGFDRGAGAVQAQAEALARDGVPVNLVIYLDGVFVPDRPPPPGTRVLNVHNASGFCDTGELKCADNVIIPACGHFAIPTHPLTLELIAHELGELAQSVPVRPRTTAIELPPPVQSAPVPRPGPPEERTTGQGNYLKPANSLASPDAIMAAEHVHSPSLRPGAADEP